MQADTDQIANPMTNPATVMVQVMAVKFACIIWPVISKLKPGTIATMRLHMVQRVAAVIANEKPSAVGFSFMSRLPYSSERLSHVIDEIKNVTITEIRICATFWHCHERPWTLKTVNNAGE